MHSSQFYIGNQHKFLSRSLFEIVFDKDPPHTGFPLGGQLYGGQ